jgi:bifunctional N-acetylglucosamine-1-phosphate-uridyltransferase/glucosamine-1-phosphate-acetyltransferase GlmU-like protein
MASREHAFLDLAAYVADLAIALPGAQGHDTPWAITFHLDRLIRERLARMGAEYETRGEIAVHRSAVIESHAILKPPCVIGPGCLVAAHAYLRGGVFLGESAIVGPSVEVKSSILLKGAKVAHLSFVGDSILGSFVNIEAGAVLANYRNERAEKEIQVAIDGEKRPTGVEKFGALVGDRSRIGANAVLAPGTILEPDSVVARLALVDQDR